MGFLLSESPPTTCEAVNENAPYLPFDVARKTRLIRECSVGRRTGAGWHVNALRTGKSDVFHSTEISLQTPLFLPLSIVS